jgi:hypothetical protein
VGDEAGLISNTDEGDEEFAQNVSGENPKVNDHLVEVGENMNIYLKYIEIYTGLNWMI